MPKHFDVAAAVCRALLGIALLALLLGLAAMDVARWRHDRRGIDSGLERELPPINVPRYGTNAALEQYADYGELAAALQQAQSMGLGVLRQQLPWAEIEPQPGTFDWAQWDAIVAAVHDAGLQLILVLDTSPAWARWGWDADNMYAPAARHEDYAAFVRAAAERYRGRVLAYQVWDSPNVSPHWGAGVIDPAAYVEMLRLASTAIRAADPAALVLAGGMSPTTESRGDNMSDLLFVREMRRLGATPYYDVLAVKAYGFWSGPYDRRVDEGVLNWSRLVLLREELQRLGAAETPLWAVEGGWVALPTDWAGAPSPTGSDSDVVQAQRLAAGLQRANEEWPWLGLICVQQLQPAASPHDPVWGLALLGPDGALTALGESLSDALAGQALLYPGQYDAARLLAGRDLGGYVDLAFYGTELSVTVASDAAPSVIRVADTLSGDLREVQLDPRARAIVLAQSHAPTRIGLRLQASPEQLASLRLIRVGHARRWHLAWWSVLATVLGAGLLALLTARDLASVPWRRAWLTLASRIASLPVAVRALTLGALAGLALWGPAASLRLFGLLGYAAVALLDPDLALRAALAALLLAPLKVRLGHWQFSAAELAILLAAAAHAWDVTARQSWRASWAGWWRRRGLADLAVALYVLLGLVATLHAVYQREAMRELRLVFIEPALLYALLRLRLRDSQDAARAARTLFWAGVALATYALIAYAFPGGVIEAEGARRARAYFGSPNNLALILERLAPLGLALGLAAATALGAKRQRWLALGGTALIVLATGLTYSRGAWLLGLPAGLLLVLALQGRRGRWVALAAIICGALLLVPLSRVPRFAELANLTTGTSFLRVRLWRSAWQMARDHPLWGVGLDNFLYYYGDYIMPGAEVDRWLSHPHNIILDFWLRLGLPGLALLALYGWTAVRSVRGALQNAPQQRAIVIGLAGGLAAMLAHGLIDSSLFVVELAGWFLTTLALLQTPRTPDTGV
jgi:O-antigen ligase